MANTKISQLTALTNPTGSEEFVYALNNANGKVTLDTMKTYTQTGTQAELVSGTNIKTINGTSILGSGDMVISGGTSYTAGTGISISSGEISNTGVTSVNGQTGDVTVSGGGGEGAYDAIVDASGNGDYTTIGAAVAAGKYNLYIKNGAYTETVGLDISTGGYLSLIGESRDGVVVTVPGNCDVSATSNRFINMGSTPKYLLIKNIKFNITLTNIDYFVRSGNTSFDIRIEDCDFTYSSTQTSNTYLFYCTECIELKSGADSQKIVSQYPRRGVYGCSFYTESSNSNRVVVWYGDSYCYGCSFTTGASAGEISFVYGNNWFDKCYIDTFQWDGGDNMLTDSVMKIKTGGLVEVSNSNSAPNQLEIDMLYRSSLEVLGTLGTSPSDGLNFGLIKDSSIEINDTSASINSGFMTRGNHIRGIYDSYVDCNGSNINVSHGANNSDFYNCGTLSIGGSSSYVGYNGNYFEATNISISIYEASFIGNAFDGASSGTHGTISITGSYGTYLGNNMRFYDITDTGTDNIKANNVGQS